MKKMILIAATAVLCFSLTACQKKETPETGLDGSGAAESSAQASVPEEDVSQSAPDSPGSSQPTDASAPDADASQDDAVSEGLDNFSVDSELVSAFAEKIQKAVSEKDTAALAELTAFPTYVGFPEEGIIVNTREEFEALDTDKLFPEELLTSIANTDITTLEPSMAGFTMCGQADYQAPSITFGLVNGELAISGINY